MTHVFSDFNWLKIVGLSLVALLVCCNSNEECYQSTYEIIEQSENNRYDQLGNNLFMANDSTSCKETQRLQCLLTNIESNWLDSTFNYIYQIRKANERYDSYQALQLFEQLISDNKFKVNFPFEYNYLSALLKESISAEQLDFVINQRVEKLSPVDQFYLTKTILLLFKNAVDDSHFELGMALHHFGLFLLNSEKGFEKYHKLRAEYLLRKGIKLMGEPQTYNKVIPNLLTSARDIFIRVDENDYAKLAELFLSFQDSSSFFIPEQRIDDINIPIIDELNLYNSIGHYYLEINDLKSIPYFEHSLSLISHLQCYYLTKLIHNYIGIVYIENDSLEMAKIHFNLANDYAQCSPNDQLYISYFNILLRKQFYPLYKDDFSIDTFIDKSFEERALGKVIMQGNGDHLNDYFVGNAVSLFTFLINETISTPSRIKQLIALMDQTKIREIKAKRKSDIKKESSDKNLRKQELLLEVNEFKDTSNYGNPAYKELFFLLADEYKKELELPALPDSIPYPAAALAQLMDDPDMQLLEYLTYDSTCIGYFYAHQKLRFFEVDYEKLSTGIEKLNSTLHEQQPLEHHLVALRNLLLPDLNIDKSHPLYINPDGLLNSLPFHLVCGDEYNVNYTTGLQDLQERNSLTIDQNKSAFFSYSDEHTLKDRETRAMEELKFGYMECKNIHSLLDNDNIPFFAGKDFNEEQLFANLDIDILHISSHASSNLENRLDNYIVVRDQDGKPKEIYSYMLEESGKSPTVAILSACDTGIGAFQNGSGTYSVSRAFAANGSQAIIKTLWNVDDQATAAFMLHLYQEWLSGESLGNSLIKARAQLRQTESQDPFYWAGFVLEGNPNIYLNNKCQ